VSCILSRSGLGLISNSQTGAP